MYQATSRYIEMSTYINMFQHISTYIKPTYVFVCIQVPEGEMRQYYLWSNCDQLLSKISGAQPYFTPLPANPIWGPKFEEIPILRSEMSNHFRARHLRFPGIFSEKSLCLNPDLLSTSPPQKKKKQKRTNPLQLCAEPCYIKG